MRFFTENGGPTGLSPAFLFDGREGYRVKTEKKIEHYRRRLAGANSDIERQELLNLLAEAESSARPRCLHYERTARAPQSSPDQHSLRAR